MFEGEYFIFSYSSDTSYGGNPPWIMRVVSGELEDVFDPYDYDESGEFHNEADIYERAAEFVHRLEIDQIYTFNSKDGINYFGRRLTHFDKDAEGADDIDTFYAVSMTEIGGVSVRKVNQSDLEAYCSSD